MQHVYFQGIDLVPTDIAAGLKLVQREQERKPHPAVLSLCVKLPLKIDKNKDLNDNW